MPGTEGSPNDPRELHPKPPFEEPNKSAGRAWSLELAPAWRRLDVFLASGESTYATGSVMDLTGGRMLP